MKLKSKLIMSGVALAACAATLTSTTYAWYTTNTEVSATGISGQALATGDSSIYISLDGQEWGQSVDLSTILANNNGLVPTSLAGDKTLRTFLPKGTPAEGVTADQAALAAGYMGAEADSSSYVKFKLYFKTAATTDGRDVKVYYKSVSLKNAASSLTLVDNLLYRQNYTKLTGSSQYSEGVTYYKFVPAAYTAYGKNGQKLTPDSWTADIKSGLYKIANDVYVKLTAGEQYSPTEKYFTMNANTGGYFVEKVDAESFDEKVASGLYIPAVASDNKDAGVGVNRNLPTYGVDFIKALGMTTKITNDGGLNNSYTETEIANSFKAYDLESFTDAIADSEGNVDLDNGNVANKPNGALNYYNEVMGYSIAKPGNGSTAAKLYAFNSLVTAAGNDRTELCTLPHTGNPVTVEFTIFLNGWDEYCYDACKGQTFNMSMAFTSTKTE